MAHITNSLQDRITDAATALLAAYIRTVMKFDLLPAEIAMLPEPKPEQEYLLYLHVPFCEKLCPFCSFNRFPFHEEVARAYFVNLRRELHMAADLGYHFGSLYIGGGTPTIMVHELAETIDLAQRLFDIRDVSVETNPNHLREDILGPLDGRVHRLSVGVQSFDDEMLRQMKRFTKYGSGEEIMERLQAAVGRFPTLNADLIFNMPHQTLQSLQRDIKLVIDSGANQVTFYPLMVSPSTQDVLADSLGTVDYRREAGLYRVITEGMSANFERSSAWAFTRQGQTLLDEYVVDYYEYVGLGAGSFSYLDGQLFVNTFSLGEYNRALSAGRMSVAWKQWLGNRARMRYRLMTDLFGLHLSPAGFKREFGAPLSWALSYEMLFLWMVGALKRSSGETLGITERGMYLSVVMMREFFIGINALRDHAREALPAAERALLDQDEPAVWVSALQGILHQLERRQH